MERRSHRILLLEIGINSPSRVAFQEDVPVFDSFHRNWWKKTYNLKLDCLSVQFNGANFLQKRKSHIWKRIKQEQIPRQPVNHFGHHSILKTFPLEHSRSRLQWYLCSSQCKCHPRKPGKTNGSWLQWQSTTWNWLPRGVGFHGEKYSHEEPPLSLPQTEAASTIFRLRNRQWAAVWRGNHWRKDKKVSESKISRETKNDQQGPTTWSKKATYHRPTRTKRVKGIPQLRFRQKRSSRNHFTMNHFAFKKEYTFRGSRNWMRDRTATEPASSSHFEKKTKLPSRRSDTHLLFGIHFSVKARWADNPQLWNGFWWCGGENFGWKGWKMGIFCCWFFSAASARVRSCQEEVGRQQSKFRTLVQCTYEDGNRTRIKISAKSPWSGMSCGKLPSLQHKPVYFALGSQN